MVEQRKMVWGKGGILDSILAATTFRIQRVALAESVEPRTYAVRSPYSRILYRVQGTSRYVMRDREFLVEPGQLVLVPTDVMLHCEHHANLSQYYTYCNIEYSGCIDLFSLVPPEQFQMSFKRGESLFRELIEAYGAITLAGRLRAQAILCELASQFTGTIRERDLHDSLGGVERFMVVMQYIDAHLAEELTLARLAGRAHLSQKYFCNLFSKTMGISPAAYVTSRRLQRARQLLATTKLAIRQIAKQIGFADALYFSRVFHQHEGMTASQYRKTQWRETGLQPGG